MPPLTVGAVSFSGRLSIGLTGKPGPEDDAIDGDSPTESKTLLPSPWQINVFRGV